MLLNCGVGEDSWESLGLQDQTSKSWKKSTLAIHWNDWCWSWSSNTLAPWFEEVTHWKRPWYWGSLKAGGEGDDKGWDGWMTSLTQWTWVWGNSGRWRRTGRPGMLQSTGLQRVGRDWVTELRWIVRRSNKSILKEISHEYSLEGLMLKHQYWPLDAKSQLTGKNPDAGKD